MALYGNVGDTPEVRKWIYIVLCDFENPKAHDQFYTLSDSFNKLDVPIPLRESVFQVMFRDERYIMVIKESVKKFNHIIKIEAKGLAYLEKVRTSVFETTEEILDAIMIDNTFEETFQIIFDLHKKNNNRVTWTKETLKPNVPTNWHTARQMMIEEKILFKISTSSVVVTSISQPVMNCTTYEEAHKLLEEKNKPKEVSSKTIHARDIISSNVGQDSDFREATPPLYPNQRVTKDEAATNQTSGVAMKFWKLISENKLISGVLTILIIALIYYLFFGIKPN